MINIRKFIITALLFLGLVHIGLGQNTLPKPKPAKDTGQIIHLLNADILLGFQGKDSNSAQKQKLIGNVKLKQGATIFTADSAIRYMNTNVLDAFGHIHINQADSINTYADELHYVGDTKIATLRNNVKMTDSRMVLTTDYLNYNMDTHVGSYYHGGKLVNQETILTSERGYYYADLKDVYFKNNVKLNNPEYKLTTDTLLYNTITHIATFLAPTAINTGKTIIYTSCGYYSTDEQFSFLCDRPTIVDSTGTLTADSLRFTKEEDLGKAYGNIVWQDTSGQAIVQSDFAISNNKRKTLLATKNPLLIFAQEKDSLFVTSDTLFSSPVIPIVTKEDSLRNDSIAFVYVQDSITRAIKDSILQVKQDSLRKVQIQQEKEKKRQQKINTLKTQLPFIEELSRQKKIDSLFPPLLTPKGLNLLVQKKDTTYFQKDTTNTFEDSILLAKQDSIQLAQEQLAKELEQKRLDSIALAKQKFKTLQAHLLEMEIPQKLSIGIIKFPILHISDTNSIYRNGEMIDRDKFLAGLSKKDTLALQKQETQPVDSSEARNLIAYYHVRLYSDSLQGIADSLYYSDIDSSFHFYGNPVIWTGHTQLTGDTIVLITKNQKPYKLLLKQHAMIINKVGPDAFNQIKGRNIIGYFNDSSQIDWMDVKGNAESIYFAQEDSTGAVIGINKASSSFIKLLFQDNHLDQVKFYKDITGEFLNPAHVKKEDIKLEGFKWEIDKRPPRKPSIPRIKEKIKPQNVQEEYQSPFQETTNPKNF